MLFRKLSTDQVVCRTVQGSICLKYFKPLSSPSPLYFGRKLCTFEALKTLCCINVLARKYAIEGLGCENQAGSSYASVIMAHQKCVN